ncbi:GNAT family N-acetyltransferase [Thiotrichales bacterium 19X7-9]|nr:GNAT family N-acetyltransferase [Thiotrichales bacterium 19X7-9]
MKFYRLKKIETPRLILRPIMLGDEIQINKAINNSLESLVKWMPWANDPSLKTTREFVEKNVLVNQSNTVTEFSMVVIHKRDKKIISCSGYNDRSNFNQGLYEIGYWCDIDYQGKGYVTEFVNALTCYAFKELHAKEVVIKTEVENLKSIAVAQRLGFENQGIVPSVTKENAQDYYFRRIDLTNILPLEIFWRYEK